MKALFFFLLLALSGWSAPIRNLIPLYPQATVDALVAGLQAQVTARLERSALPAFAVWSPNRTEFEIRAEFATLDAWRRALWFENPSATPLVSNPDYVCCLPLARNMKYTYPDALPFAYNTIHEYYNGSWVVTGDRLVMMLEGPTYYTQDAFFFTLTAYRASHLVCISAESATRSTEVCPYWDNALNRAGNQITVPLDWTAAYIQNITPITLPFTSIYEWATERGPTAATLCAAIRDVRLRSSGTIAIHCTKGCGRSGLFIAGLQAFDALDALTDGFSLGELVATLSLQRINAVSTAEQYILLHRLLDYYISH